MEMDTPPLSTAHPVSPITGRKSDYVRALSVGELTRRWREELQVDPGRNFAELTSVTHWRCPDTGLEFYEPAAAAGAAPMYEALSRYPWYYMDTKWEFDIGLDFLKAGDRVLEVGSGFGHFLRAARAANCDVSGVEFNPDAARTARSAGFTIYEEPLSKIAPSLLGAFDCICSFQVLEHVAAPRPFLEDMIAMVKPGGLLILSVPNADVMTFADPDRLNLLDQPPHHMTHWNETAFRTLEKHLPLRVKQFVREPLQPYHVNWYVDGLSRRLSRTLGPFAGKIIFNRLAVRIMAAVMNLGLRRHVSGHTLLVVFERV
ncbi:MAG: hypothetical protein C3F11_13270 [Methylocystaceae bacterium]|nr:MAG: hypothetical protein C3F11_13270 [Methylocystaceae bacterium]